MAKLNLQDVVFVKSAASPADFLRDMTPQIVFSGRSNVGKSSVINRVLGRKQIARVSGVPGKTIHVNYFRLGTAAYFVDLPGYGYARVSATERARWKTLMESFFSDHERISLGVMIVDSRHKPTADDVIMARWFIETERPFTVVANKIDKVKKSALEANLALIRETLELPEAVTVIPFSAETGANRVQLISEIEHAL
ncbi:MAG: ribosome biogenesis GTP-binding protein YihA/YsxC [Oscillospiraceae bacterium]|jgi:GTP-binding protein|nr:ribosome biogenesis GTP-binding protein YihA/YsxC [Oscillospiraceae bacterium]